MKTLRDKDGNEWAPFVNQYQQRMLRCIAGARLAEEIHDPRLGAPPQEQRRPVRQHDPWLAGLDQSDFPGLWD